VKARGDGSIVFGRGVANAELYLENNDGPSFMVGFNSSNPTFYISRPAASGPYFDKTGRIAIGNIRNSSGYMDPQAKLHLRADEGENAAIFIQPNNFLGGEKAMLALGGLNYGISSDVSSGFTFRSSADYKFLGGRMGIGNFMYNPPEAKLHIRSQAGEAADIYIEPYKAPVQGGENSWQASLFLGDMENGISCRSNLGMVYGTTQNHIFQGGKVGIGTIEPTAVLHVDDNGGSLKYENANVSIYGRQSPASMSFNNADGYNWNITNHSNHKTLYFSYGISGKMGISEDVGVLVNERVIVCDMSQTPLSQIPSAGIQVIQNNDADKKSAEYVTDDGRRIFFVPHLSNSGYSPMSTNKDAGIFWSDGLHNVNQNDQGGLLIAAHRDGANNGLKIDANGNVGIGTVDPNARLDVNGKLQISGSDQNNVSFIIKNQEYGPVFMISPSGQTFISNKLWAQEIEVLANVDWPDFVFSESYKLKPLNEVEDFIIENRHLPDMPSQEDVTENGINLGEMDALLLQKIEELTLYIIKQDKKIDELNERIEDLSDDK
jgi:hypothetical protein